MEEILADKVMAAASRPYRKYRDYFDLGWLWAKSMAHGSPVVDTSLILKKASDYKERVEPFLEKLSAACEIRNEDKEGFQSELSHFMSIKKKELDSVYEAYFLRGIEFLRQILTKTISMYLNDENKLSS